MTKRKIAVVGAGVAGLSAAWLLNKAHDVTLFEAEPRLGGHAHTHDHAATAIDVGFIVFNEKTYPNFTAMLRHLKVAVDETEMSFAVSLGKGRMEYSGRSLATLLGTPRLAVSPSHLAMIRDLVRFYRSATRLAAGLDESVSLGAFLKSHGFGRSFIELHLVPMAAAIWSSHPGQMLDYPAKAFIEFFENHQLFVLGEREKWRTVRGGSRNYVKHLVQGLATRVGDPVARVERGSKPRVITASGEAQVFDDVVLACHADQALRLLAEPTAAEQALLLPFSYSANHVVLHRDASLMPRRRRHWSAWNYVGDKASDPCGVTYWMNALQQLDTQTNHFVSLNPAHRPDARLTDLAFDCTHPIFTTQTRTAQKDLWSLQGERNTWFCGAYFGAGFHEDGLQAGLAVAEQLGGLRRPWAVANESGRIYLGEAEPLLLRAAE